jgi:hypothetical protein
MVRIFNSTSRLVILASFAGSNRNFATSFIRPGLRNNRVSQIKQMSTKRVLVPIADGSEEIETTCITDTLTRFGASVTVASVMPDLVCTMSRGIKVCYHDYIPNLVSARIASLH